MSRIGKTKFVLETLKEKGAVAFFFVSRNHFLDVLLTHWRASLSEAVGVPTGEDAEGSGAVTRPIGKAGLDEWAAFWEEAFATAAAHARASSRPVAILLDGADTAEKCWPGAIERLRAVWERSERSIRAEGDGRAPGIFLVLTETVVRDPQEPPLSTVPAWNDRVAAPVPVTDRFPAAERIDLRPWPPEVLRAVLSAFNPRATDEDFSRSGRSRADGPTSRRRSFSEAHGRRTTSSSPSPSRGRGSGSTRNSVSCGSFRTRWVSTCAT